MTTHWVDVSSGAVVRVSVDPPTHGGTLIAAAQAPPSEWHLWQDGAWALPDVPTEITNAQMRAILIEDGLFDGINGALSAAANGTTAQRLSWQAWEYANVVSRGSALVASLAAGLGLTSGQVDTMFRRAARVQF